MNLVHLSYFPNILNYIIFYNSKRICFEIHDNYQKQTYRNRCYIYGANGKMGLSIPVKFTQKKRTKTIDIEIDNSNCWKKNHWKSILSAYRSSPFFEYYEAELKCLFENEDKLLWPFLLKCIKKINECLEIKFDFTLSKEFKKFSRNDYRELINVNYREDFNINSYIQVFENKFGYLKNLSILDLLFNLGPESKNFIRTNSHIFNQFDN